MTVWKFFLDEINFSIKKSKVLIHIKTFNLSLRNYICLGRREYNFKSDQKVFNKILLYLYDQV